MHANRETKGKLVKNEIKTCIAKRMFLRVENSWSSLICNKSQRVSSPD